MSHEDSPNAGVEPAVLTNSEGRKVPVRLIGEQHVKDDLGWIPTVKDWLTNLRLEPWMGRTPFRPMEQAKAGEEQAERANAAADNTETAT